MPIERIEDPSIRIKPPRKLLDFLLEHANDAKSLPKDLSDFIKEDKNDCEVTLTVKDVRWLKEFLDQYRERTEEKIYLHELLEDSELELPMPKVTPRNPELDARVQKLIAQQNARQYRAMTKDVDSVRKGLPEDTIAYQLKQINRQLIAIAQFIFSVLAGFAFGFIGIELIVGNLDFGFRLLLGIMCALVIALAEIYFLAIKLNEDTADDGAAIQPMSKKLHQE